MKKWLPNPLILIAIISIFLVIAESGLLGKSVYRYVSLFIITVIGGSIIPIGSPIIISASAASGMAQTPLIIITTIGFTVGITINYFLAQILGKSYVERKLSVKRYEHAVRWWDTWGLALLIAFAFIPFLPFNLLALVCGLFRVYFPFFLCINFAGSLSTAYLLINFGAGMGQWIELML